MDVELLKKCARLWREARFEVKEKNIGGILESEPSKKCTRLEREGRFEAKKVKPQQICTLKRLFAWQAQWVLHLHKRSQT